MFKVSTHRKMRLGRLRLGLGFFNPLPGTVFRDEDLDYDGPTEEELLDDLKKEYGVPSSEEDGQSKEEE
jgi:hypothetical protein